MNIAYDLVTEIMTNQRHEEDKKYQASRRALSLLNKLIHIVNKKKKDSVKYQYMVNKLFGDMNRLRASVKRSDKVIKELLRSRNLKNDEIYNIAEVA